VQSALPPTLRKKREGWGTPFVFLERKPRPKGGPAPRTHDSACMSTLCAKPTHRKVRDEWGTRQRTREGWGTPFVLLERKPKFDFDIQHFRCVIPEDVYLSDF
jgi:hypothetical protein